MKFSNKIAVIGLVVCFHAAVLSYPALMIAVLVLCAPAATLLVPVRAMGHAEYSEFMRPPEQGVQFGTMASAGEMPRIALFK